MKIQDFLRQLLAINLAMADSFKRAGFTYDDSLATSLNDHAYVARKVKEFEDQSKSLLDELKKPFDS